MNMKKVYIKPETEIAELEVVTMLAISDGGGMNVDGDNELDPDAGDGELANRRRNYWNEVGGGW